MDVSEMIGLLEGLARDEDVAASTRVRAVEVLLRIGKSVPEEDREWQDIISQFGLDDHAE